MNKQNLFKNSEVSKQQFLEQYWHKKPILFRNAIDLSDLDVLPNKQKVQQLSYDDDIQSRVVYKKSETEYDVGFGPFIENHWNELEHDCWNLLVSDIDKWQPKSRNILKYFSFIRNWILDDIMVSCGSIGGTVGPHTDHYDVFLLQVHGQRMWEYGKNKIFNPDLMPEQALKLMSKFNADEANLMNPGDVLYLPPEVAHYGTVKTDDCVTCSIGLRTPSHSELLTSFIDHLAQNISANHRFQEPEFTKQPETGEITKDDINNISKILTSHLSSNNTKTNKLSDWFGQYITEYRSLFYEFNTYQDNNEQLFSYDLTLSPFSKACYFKKSQCIDLFVNGQKFESSLILAEAICDAKTITVSTLKTANNSDKTIIEKLFENGSLINKNQ